ncbi:hypothetical protein FA15DRAFT_576367, partial [Coprinopsis marcescibilis]
MGFWSPSDTGVGYQCDISENDFEKGIFYFEALCMASTLTWLTKEFSRKHRDCSKPVKVIIYCDNTNTVLVFNILKASEKYNKILVHTANLLIKFNIQLKVDHIPGEKNMVADLLLRENTTKLKSLLPTLSISRFTPPSL